MNKLKTYKIKFFARHYSPDKLESLKVFRDELIIPLDKYLRNYNRDLSRFKCDILEIYQNFFNQIGYFKSLITGRLKDERKYFKPLDILREEFMKLSNAEEGDLISIDSFDIIGLIDKVRPNLYLFYITEENCKLFVDRLTNELFDYLGVRSYFLPRSAVKLIEKYRISEEKDISKLYMDDLIVGICLPKRFLNKSESNDETIPCRFSNEYDSDLSIVISDNHYLYLGRYPEIYFTKNPS